MAFGGAETVHEQSRGHRGFCVEDKIVKSHEIQPKAGSCDLVCRQIQAMQLECEAATGELDVVQRIYSKDEDGDSLLHVAIILKRVDIATCFLDITPDSYLLNIANNLCQTPLHLAVITKQTELIRRLLIVGAELEVQDREGNTPLHIACREGISAVVRSLVTPISEIEVPTYTDAVPYTKIPQNLEIRNYDGQTCLHIAAANGRIEILEILLTNSADINSRECKTGRTVCHFAAETKDYCLLDRILCHPKVDANARTYSGLSPIDIAREKGDYIAVEKLVAAGAELQNGEE